MDEWTSPQISPTYWQEFDDDRNLVITIRAQEQLDYVLKERGLPSLTMAELRKIGHLKLRGISIFIYTYPLPRLIPAPSGWARSDGMALPRFDYDAEPAPEDE